MTSEVPEMVMRVAKALSGAPFPSRRSITHALTVLESMREPTAEMSEAGRWPAEDDGSFACWQAMIDAALASPPKE